MISATTISPLNRRIVDGVAPPFSFGNALQFDGVNDRVTIPSITSGTTWSFSAWFNYSTFGGMLISSGVDFVRLTSATNVNIRFSNQYNFTISSINLNEWNHLCVRVDSGVAKVYVNGLESSTGSQNISFSVNFIYLGSRTSDFFFGGKLDEIAIWNTSLLDADILSLYNGGLGDYATNYSPANLQAYWRMNGSGTDTTAVDEQGNYDGALNNFPASGMWVAH